MMAPLLAPDDLRHAASFQAQRVFAAAADRGGRGVDASRQLRVLVVEDEAIAALHLEMLLMDLGYQVVDIAAEGPKAVAAAAEHRPDLVLMDIHLANGTDGIEAAVEIRDRFDIPAVFVSAYIDAETMQRAEPAQPISFVSKPYSQARMKDTLAKAAATLRN